jgi:murein DD-endopeptidase
MNKKIIKIIFYCLFFPYPGLAQFHTVRQFSTIKTETGQLLCETKTAGLNAITQDKEAAEMLPDSVIEDTRNTVNISLPLKRIKITSGFGNRFHPIEKKIIFHADIDLKANYEAFYCFAAGVVLRAGYDEKSGNYLVINHGKLETVYCHLSQIFVKENEKVNAGQRLGITGNTGNTTGAHLHFAMKWEGIAIDPMKVIRFVLKK